MDNAQISETKALIERLMDSWSQQGVRIRPGASVERIGRFETQYQIRLPTDFRHYLGTVDGMDQARMDENMFSFLSIDAIKRIPEELANFGGIPDYRDIVRTLPDPPHWFVIVDFLISSAVYAIRLSPNDENNTPVLWIGDGTRHRVVAPSFSAFLEVYLSNPASLL